MTLDDLREGANRALQGLLGGTTQRSPLHYLCSRKMFVERVGRGLYRMTAAGVAHLA